MAITDYFERKLDDKNRLTIPAELRHEFEGGEVVITRGFGQYLHIYPRTVWDEQVEPELKGSILDERVADLNVRMRTGRAVSTMDARQGRITLEQHLLEYAGAYWRITAHELAQAL